MKLDLLDANAKDKVTAGKINVHALKMVLFALHQFVIIASNKTSRVESIGVEIIKNQYIRINALESANQRSKVQV